MRNSEIPYTLPSEIRLSSFDLKIAEALQAYNSAENSVYVQTFERKFASHLEDKNERIILVNQSLQKLRKRFPGNVATVTKGANKGKLWWFGNAKIEGGKIISATEFKRTA